MNAGNIQFKPNPTTNPTAIGNNWNHLTTSEESDEQQDDFDHKKKLQQMVSSANQFCFKITTRFPLDPFPDEIIIDIHKVSVIYKSFLSKDVLSIPIKDINKVEVVNDFLYASIEIVNGSQTTTLNIKWLGKNEAREAQAILQGLLVAYKNDIDISKFDPNEINLNLKTLGSPIS